MTEPVLISESPAAVRASQLNAQTRVLQTYESHRQQTMALITAAMACETTASTESERTISILGAGNCLDLDLAQVTRCFRVVNLLDLDPAALEFGMSHQNGMDRDRIRLHAPVDLAAPLAVLTSGNLVDHEFVDSACAKLLRAVRNNALFGSRCCCVYLRAKPDDRCNYKCMLRAASAFPAFAAVRAARPFLSSAAAAQAGRSRRFYF